MLLWSDEMISVREWHVMAREITSYHNESRVSEDASAIHLVRNGYFFENNQFALIIHKIFLIANTINIYITNQSGVYFWKTFLKF